MSMNTTAVVDTYSSYATTQTTTDKTKEKQETSAAASAKTEDKATETAGGGVVYEKASEEKKATYSINKMSQEERTALVNQLKADQESRQQQLVSLVQKMMGQQATAYGNATDIWKFLAEGNYTVDAQTKAQAQEDISENGYYGVKQTSQRLFDFAKALAGDDPDKLKEMQSAIEKGYKQAEKTWGGELPEISKQTLDATNKLFDEYYKTAGTTGAEA